MALGGVPTGSINAQLAANVNGIQSICGAKPSVIANEPTIGTMKVTSAKFDMISVTKIPMKITITRIIRIE